MIKIRLVTGLLAATALLVPTVAQAAAVTYEPINSADATEDVVDRGFSPADKPFLDIATFRGTRTKSTFKMVARYSQLSKKVRTRYFGGLDNSKTGAEDLKNVFVELRTDSDGRQHTTVYKSVYDVSADKSSIRTLPCSGAKATPDYVEDKIVFTLPASCYPFDPDGAGLNFTAEVWTANRWADGPLSAKSKPGDYQDSAGDAWDWLQKM